MVGSSLNYKSVFLWICSHILCCIEDSVKDQIKILPEFNAFEKIAYNPQSRRRVWPAKQNCHLALYRWQSSPLPPCSVRTSLEGRNSSAVESCLCAALPLAALNAGVSLKKDVSLHGMKQRKKPCTAISATWCRSFLLYFWGRTLSC